MKHRTAEILSLAGISMLILGGLTPSASAAEEAPERDVATSIFADQLLGLKDQPTAPGRSVSALALNGGELYVGYGDYTANTGPIDLYGYDTETGAADLKLRIPTEAVYSFAEINGKLYAPYTDPRAPWTSKVGFASNRDGEWKNHDHVQLIHAYDVASTDGRNLFIAGSIQEAGRYYAGIWYSADGETNWELIRKVGSPTDQGETDRFYWLKTAGGKLYAVAKVGGQRTFDTWENGNWSSVAIPANALSTFEPQVTADLQIMGDRIVSTLVSPSASAGAPIKNMVYSIPENRLISADESTVDAGNPWDPENGQSFSKLAKSGSTLYGMTGGGRLYSSSDGLNWKYKMTALDVLMPGTFAVDEANQKVYIAMNPSPLNGNKPAHILVANIPKTVDPGGDPGSGTGSGQSAFCIVTTSENAGKILKGAAGGSNCAVLRGSGE